MHQNGHAVIIEPSHTICSFPPSLNKTAFYVCTTPQLFWHPENLLLRTELLDSLSSYFLLCVPCNFCFLHVCSFFPNLSPLWHQISSHRLEGEETLTSTSPVCISLTSCHDLVVVFSFVQHFLLCTSNLNFLLSLADWQLAILCLINST